MKGNVPKNFKLHIKHGTFANALLLIDLSTEMFPLFFSNNSGLF